MAITEVTRRNIFDALVVAETDWAGRLEEPDFLARIYDLESTPSDDGRFANAYGDIWQHRVNNRDWPRDWVFRDSRFHLIDGPDDIFLKFLSEMIHPAVRSSMTESDQLKEMFNEYLKSDGYEFIESSRISGKPVFTARAISTGTTYPVDTLRTTFTSIDSAYISNQIARMETSVNLDPDLAIGTAKELVETCCKTILTERGVEIPQRSDLSQLVKQTTRILSVTPENVPSDSPARDSIRRVLGSLGSITQGIAELRNSYGTGHGRIAAGIGLDSRNARLVVGSASTLATFLWDTHQEEPNPTT